VYIFNFEAKYEVSNFVLFEVISATQTGNSKTDFQVDFHEILNMSLVTIHGGYYFFKIRHFRATFKLSDIKNL